MLAGLKLQPELQETCLMLARREGQPAAARQVPPVACVAQYGRGHVGKRGCSARWRERTRRRAGLKLQPELQET